MIAFISFCYVFWLIITVFQQTGMVRTSRDTFFVQPLAAHLAKGLGTRFDGAPHLVYKKPMEEEREFVCQVKEG